MNEVEELSKLDPAGLPPLKPVLLDDLYQGVLKNLHLELGRGPALYLLSPSYSVLNPTPDEGITEFITRNETLLDYLKEAIVQNLAVYSVLVDISSYFIEQNSGLVLARLRERDSDGRRFEISSTPTSPRSSCPATRTRSTSAAISWTCSARSGSISASRTRSSPSRPSSSG